MNRYEEAFKSAKARRESALIPFAVAGDPGPDVFLDVIKAYVDGGADVLEIGYPFSDPVADGPVNQRASQRAISAGLNHSLFFSLVKEIRSFTDIPIGLLTYANTINHLGAATFCRRAALAGIDSILTADMPPEESVDLDAQMHKHGIGRVYIVSELTPDDRMQYIGGRVDSFVYVVSRPGVTGADTALSSSVKATLARLRRVSKKPAAVGFGIATPSHVREVAGAGAQGVIVGSALVNMIEDAVNKGVSPARALKKKVKELKAATHHA
jgi:tryptophan synthase alpha chain